MHCWFTHAHAVISLEHRRTHPKQVEPWAILNCPELALGIHVKGNLTDNSEVTLKLQRKIGEVGSALLPVFQEP